jgi:hypothetical protein
MWSKNKYKKGKEKGKKYERINYSISWRIIF